MAYRIEGDAPFDAGRARVDVDDDGEIHATDEASATVVGVALLLVDAGEDVAPTPTGPAMPARLDREPNRFVTLVGIVGHPVVSGDPPEVPSPELPDDAVS